MKTCPHCDELFVPQNSLQKFCTRWCKDAYKFEWENPEEPEEQDE